MSKKGFTLVELLAVIILLLAICMVSYPSLTNFLKNNKATEKDTYEKNLCLAAKTYINANKSSYSNIDIVGTKYEINISDLIEYGIVDHKLVEPNTEEYAIDHKIIVEVDEDKSLKCTYE